MPSGKLDLTPSFIGSEDMLNARVCALQGNVVVLDEAHNLINAINDAHSPRVTLKQVRVLISTASLTVKRYYSLRHK